MFKSFRSISIMEGLSFLVILSVTTGWISRDYVYYLGMTHGVLFLLYLVFSLVVATKEDWSLKIWLPVFLASLCPFAFIPVELFLKKSSTEKHSKAEPT